MFRPNVICLNASQARGQGEQMCNLMVIIKMVGHLMSSLLDNVYRPCTVSMKSVSEYDQIQFIMSDSHHSLI